MAREYNGHKSWNAWNVSLWINNDEGLYNLAKKCIATSRTRGKAAGKFLQEVGTDRTPDGGRYNLTVVKAAMVGM